MNPAQYGDGFGGDYGTGDPSDGFSQGNPQSGYSTTNAGSAYSGGATGSIGSGGYNATDNGDGYSATNPNAAYGGMGVNNGFAGNNFDQNGSSQPDSYGSGAGGAYSDPFTMTVAPSGSGAAPRQPRFPHPEKSRADVEDLTSYVGGSGTGG
jgi:hypothetical protein